MQVHYGKQMPAKCRVRTVTLVVINIQSCGIVTMTMLHLIKWFGSWGASGGFIGRQRAVKIITKLRGGQHGEWAKLENHDQLTIHTEARFPRVSGAMRSKWQYHTDNRRTIDLINSTQTNRRALCDFHITIVSSVCDVCYCSCASVSFLYQRPGTFLWYIQEKNLACAHFLWMHFLLINNIIAAHRGSETFTV